MKLRIKLVIFSCILSLGLCAKGAYAQKNDSLTKQLKKHSLIVSLNGIYNYFSNNTLFTLYSPSGRTPNSSQMVYYWQYKYCDTYTFDLSLQYNRYLSKQFSLSTGIRFDQLKEVQKTLVYIDSSSFLPDPKELTINMYSLSVPLVGNFYLKRFKIGLGLDAYFFSVAKSVYLFEHNVEKKFSDISYGLLFFGQESLAFKLYQNKGIYLQLGLIHSLNFDKKIGYNKFFTFGLCIEIPR